jgi:very-short-patch-repair endonuclease
MLIEIKIIKQRYKRAKHIGVYECDECHKIYEGRVRFGREKSLHFCSQDCKYKSKLLQKKISDKNEELYGGRGFKSLDLKKKTQDTCIEKYGVDHPWKDKETREKGVETCRELYGSGGVLGSPILRKEFEATMLERHGVIHPMLSPVIQQQKRETCLEKYGVDHPQKSEIVQEKVRNTCLERFGTTTALTSPQIRDKFDYVENNRKRIETLIKEDRLWTSKPEQLLGIWLKQEFSEKDILSQVWICHQSIDFVIKSLKLYVQLDGVYWHGLIEKLAPGAKNKIEKDNQLNSWFEENEELNLFRISDLQWLKIIEKQEYN